MIPQYAIRNPQSTIRVLLVDDSLVALRILKLMLSAEPGIEVVGTAANGLEALELVRKLNPDVICTDLHMPVMDGLELTRAVMERYPRPILVVSVSTGHGAPETFRLLEAGAVDVMLKPAITGDDDLRQPSRELADKIRILAGVRVFRRSVRQTSVPAPVPSNIPSPPTSARIVAIGASTGGPQALREILCRLPATFTLPVVCVQHIGSEFMPELVSWLAEASSLRVRKALQGETAQPGTVYFASDDAHLEWDDCGRFALSHALPIDGHRPSVTAMMKAAASCFGAGTVGVLLTGMGRDGADGMASINAAGGITIAQDEESSVVYGMPKQAVELGAVQHVLPLGQIAPVLIAIANGGMRST